MEPTLVVTTLGGTEYNMTDNYYRRAAEESTNQLFCGKDIENLSLCRVSSIMF